MSLPVLWVKGSGGDLGSMRLDGFATLYHEKLLGLEQLYRGVEHEDEMVGLLAAYRASGWRQEMAGKRKAMAPGTGIV